jgi:hypothetical protein
METFNHNYLKNLKGRDYFGIIGADRNMILKLSHINRIGREWTDFSWLRI